jgi:IS5 family transposase
MGVPAKPVRMALGALILKERCGFPTKNWWNRSSEIRIFNILLDYRSFKKAPFDPSMMVYFRKRFDAQTLQAINEIICGVKPKEDFEDFDQDQTPPTPPLPAGKGTKVF